MIIPSFIIPVGLKLSKARLVSQGTSLVIAAASLRKRSTCPCCGKSSKYIHGFYERRLSDLPVSGKEVKVTIRVRKFFCKNRKCTRKIFTERFDTEILPHKRSFSRFDDLVRSVGIELGGNKGAALCKVIGFPISPSSVLRTVKGTVILAKAQTSGTIGVDDWAYKKGRNYGTIIVDLINRKVIDLLPDREADTLANWLESHPEVHTVSRDRASAYALGIRTGAPKAIQVADRFHLMVNVRDAFQTSLRKHSTVIKECFLEYGSPNTEKGDSLNNKEEKKPEIKKYTDTPQQSEEGGVFIGNVGADKQFKFQKAKELHQKGYGIKSIAKQLGAGVKTIRKYIASECLISRESKGSSTMTNFHSFESELLRLYETKTTYLGLFNHIKGLGYNGKYSQFCERMNRLTHEGRVDKSKVDNTPPLNKPFKTWSNSRLAFMAMAKTGTLNVEDQKYLDILLLKSPQINNSSILAQSFRELFVAKKEGSLREWIEKATSDQSELKSFAKGIDSDFEAVNQAVVSTISNGQVEGQVNRLKTIKRKMYGRAGYELLKKMVLIGLG